MRRTLILLASLLIMLLGLWGTVVIHFDEDRLRSIVATQLTDQTGRRVEILGSLRLRFSPLPHIELTDVTVAGPEDFEGPALLRAERLSMSIRLLPLVRGSLRPGAVAVEGATLTLATDPDGRTSLDGLLADARHPAGHAAQLLASRQMQLEDLRVVITDLASRRVDQLVVDRIELDRFAFDQALDFRFHGNFGDPPLFSSLTVEGLLMVPAERERPMRLSNMRLAGRLADGGQALEVHGQLAMSAMPPLRLALSDGRLALAGQSFELEAGYDAGADGVLRLAARGASLDWPLVGGVVREERSALLAHLAALDTELALQVGRARIHGRRLEPFDLGLRTHDGILDVQAFEGMVPGAVVSGHGWRDLRVVPTEGNLVLNLTIDDLSVMLAALDLPAVLEGSGQASLELSRLPDAAGSGAVGEGEFEIWQGNWHSGAQGLGTVSFDRLAGRLRWLPEAVDFPDLVISGPEWVLDGWLSVSLPDQHVAGRLIDADESLGFVVSGSLAAPVTAPRIEAEDSP